ncbi:MAG TPA: NfeD family protein [Candidatus Angelobacter sp.]|nr:NfeD family protein [Candidatus Angelobacter sp.]
MNWETFYLFCFYFGLAMSALSLFSGAFHLHLPAKWHLPFHAHHHGGFFRFRFGAKSGGNTMDIPFFNMSTMMAFLCWFGGMGYVLTHYSTVWFVVALLASIMTGLGGASIVFWFLVKVLLRYELPLDPADFEMVGVVGALIMPIRLNGTGELVYSQQGTRRVVGAKSEDGQAIAKDSEVVVTRYENGIAYVRPWVEFADEHGVGIADEEHEKKKLEL